MEKGWKKDDLWVTCSAVDSAVFPFSFGSHLQAFAFLDECALPQPSFLGVRDLPHHSLRTVPFISKLEALGVLLHAFPSAIAVAQPSSLSNLRPTAVYGWAVLVGTEAAQCNTKLPCPPRIVLQWTLISNAEAVNDVVICAMSKSRNYRQHPMNRDHHLNNDTSAHDQNMMEGTLADDEGEDTNPDDLRPISEHDRTPRMKKHPCPDTPGRTSLGEKQKQLFDEILTTPRVALINWHPGIGWAALSSHASSSSQDECCSQEESAIVHTASKGKQKEVRDQSSVEVEQLLPLVEPVHDPRNFYASDSPVIEDPDSDEELYKSAEEDVENIELDGQGDGVANESNSGSNVWSSLDHLGHPSDRAGQYQGELSGYSGTNDVQQGSQAYIIGLLEQIARNTDPTHAAGRRGDRKVHSRRGRSPKSVRIELSLLLKDNPPYGRTPSPSQLSTFMSEWESSGHGTKACETTTANFMVDIAGDLKLPWNVSEGQAFTDYFIKKIGHDDTPKMRREIEKAFDTRIRSLKSRWKRNMLPQAAKVAERSKHSKRQCKYQ
ncbi:hypothetical protein EDB84DRAFT_1446663, partial [Lactarius hengduanensis]